jgi:thioredoxin 1
MLSSLFGRGKKKPKPVPAPAVQGATPAFAQPVDVTDATFAEAIVASPQLAVVDFWAEWCAPCTTMSAYVGFLAADFAGRLTVAALDVDENPATAERDGVMALPTLLFLAGGIEVGRIVGLSPYPEIKRQAADLLAQYSSEPNSSSPPGEVHDASL